MNRFLVLCFVLYASVVSAQPRFEDKHADLLQAYVNKFGLPELNDDKARDWTRHLAEQFVFNFPTEGWGHKSGGNGRPPSTDVIARQCCGGFWGYDLILNQGIPSQSLIPRPGVLNLAGQAFIPVTGNNHIGDVVNPPTPPTPPPPVPPVDTLTPRVLELEQRVSGLLNIVEGLLVKVNELNRQHFELSDYARASAADLGNRMNIIESKPIPTGCRARFIGQNVGCNLIFP